MFLIRVFFVIIFFLTPLSIRSASAQSVPQNQEAHHQIANEDCLMCHDAFHMDKFNTSVHGERLCISCHTDIKELPHPEQLKSVRCSQCHRLESEIYLSSDHGLAVKAGKEAAACMDCHGEPHQIVSHRNAESPVFRKNIPETCATCHENPERMHGAELAEHFPVKSYSATVHGKALAEGVLSTAVCTDCHGSHDLHAATNPQSKLYRTKVPFTCGKCHENVLGIYERSIHGKAALSGKWEAPVCTDCHGEHTILSHLNPESSVFASNLSVKTCAHCHASERVIRKYHLPGDVVETFLESYHGLASKFGITTVANCSSCHGAHDILPASDPRSSIHKDNLVQTCGKCHPNAGEQLTKGSIHLSPSPSRDQIVYYVRTFYIGLICLVIGLMLLHNLIDFRSKLRAHYEKASVEAKHVRFTKVERVQHLLLILSFITLAYSGFALKYPNSWWAAPFSAFGGDVNVRGWVHRIAALLFTVLSIYHVFFLLISKRGRFELKSMLPRWRDFADFGRTVRYNLKRTGKAPAYGRFSYIEKLEYWALVWGSLVMIITGAILTFENFAMGFFPKWAMDVAAVIHYYEAVLATLAIIVWHFYFTIFDPEQYPLNLSMFTGKSRHSDQDNQD